MEACGGVFHAQTSHGSLCGANDPPGQKPLLDGARQVVVVIVFILNTYSFCLGYLNTCLFPLFDANLSPRNELILSTKPK